MSDRTVEIPRLTIEFAGDTPTYPSENGRWCRYSDVAPLVRELEEAKRDGAEAARLLVERTDEKLAAEDRADQLQQQLATEEALHRDIRVRAEDRLERLTECESTAVRRYEEVRQLQQQFDAVRGALEETRVAFSVLAGEEKTRKLWAEERPSKGRLADMAAARLAVYGDIITRLRALLATLHTQEEK